MLGYNTNDPRKGSLLKLNDCLELVVVPKKEGGFGPTLELEVRLPTSVGVAHRMGAMEAHGEVHLTKGCGIVAVVTNRIDTTKNVVGSALGGYTAKFE